LECRKFVRGGNRTEGRRRVFLGGRVVVTGSQGGVKVKVLWVSCGWIDFKVRWVRGFCEKGKEEVEGEERGGNIVGWEVGGWVLGFGDGLVK
jgi:hypothetical protein